MTTSPPGLMRRGLLLFGAAALLLGVLFFGTAGTFDYWQAWVYLAILLIPMLAVLLYFLRRDPALLERRFQAREQEQRQQGIVNCGVVIMLLAYLIPGLSQRFGWPTVRPAISIAADVVVLLAYGMFFLVLRENSYAARTVAVESGQQVVTTGPYRYVRHPMYLALSLLYVLSPLALGSAWAVLPALFLVVVLVVRIRDEERVLFEGLPGYSEYQQKTRYRLIPGVW
ncbi:MAG TPA: isoprenylcysteine carboxylmethyltransferase family protein [Anaerolineales bacterium]|nr:isoprenylcysteine carboxylmethyltransferase family protein [Anaerolineales bacterium]